MENKTNKLKEKMSKLLSKTDKKEIENNSNQEEPMVEVIQDKKVKKKKHIAILWAVLIAVIVVAIAVIVVVIYKGTKPKQKEEAVFSAETMLQDVLDIAELSGAKYSYNGVATVSNKKGSAKYYVKYNGSVNIGINFKDIKIISNEETKEIIITIPDCKLLSTPTVDAGTLEYIFVDDKYNTETISADAYKAANKDLEKRVSEDEKLFEVANDNLRTTVEALTKPLIEQFAPEYTIIVKTKEDTK